jgi:hypothetical protein
MVQELKSAQDFEVFGGFKPWHRLGEHSTIQKRPGRDGCAFFAALAVVFSSNPLYSEQRASALPSCL